MFFFFVLFTLIIFLLFCINRAFCLRSVLEPLSLDCYANIPQNEFVIRMVIGHSLSSSSSTLPLSSSSLIHLMQQLFRFCRDQDDNQCTFLFFQFHHILYLFCHSFHLMCSFSRFRYVFADFANGME